MKKKRLNKKQLEQKIKDLEEVLDIYKKKFIQSKIFSQIIENLKVLAESACSEYCAHAFPEPPCSHLLARHVIEACHTIHSSFRAYINI